MGVKIAKNKISEFLRGLSEEYRVFTPSTNGVTKFAEMKNPEDVLIYPNRTDISLKPLFFPPEEVFFHFKKSDEGYDLADNLHGLKAEKKVLFGVRNCDLRGLEVLDRYMISEFSDPYYSRRRENTVIIGITCEYPRDTCFCTAFGPLVPEKGYDLWLTDIGNYYYVDVGSETGKKLLNSLFEEATEDDRMKRDMKILSVEREINKHAHLDLCEVKRCAKHLTNAVEDPIWKELGEKCLSCGKCNFICPTCHCFDVKDVTNLDGSEGQRERVWDSCHLFSYAQTSAENFRKERHARVRYRIYDKFVFPVMRYGVYACSGCGRCIDICPADIDIRDVVRRLIA